MPRGRPRGPSVSRVCKTCGAAFEVFPSTGIKGGNYCSRSCYIGRPQPVSERFWKKVKVAGPEECWIWQASLCGRGYGQFHPETGFPVRAHRFSYTIHHGPIPEGLCVMHMCDTPACVNPAHLRLGTKQDNSNDSASKGRCPLTKLTTKQAAEILSLKGAGMSAAAVGRQYGIGRGHVHRIWSRRIWKHLDYPAGYFENRHSYSATAQSSGSALLDQIFHKEKVAING